MARRIVILVALAVAAILFLSFDLHHYLTFTGVKERHGSLVTLFQQRPALVVLGFMVMHVTALALCIPGAVLSMALAGGAVFGPLLGTVIVLSSLTIGDSVGFLVARHLLRDFMPGRFRRRLETAGLGIEKDGGFYLLAMRLMPVLPYFMVNFTFALTPMRLRIFAPVSLVGLVPATALYVNAGTELSRIAAPSDILSARIIGYFILIAALPIAARWAWRKSLGRTSRRAPEA